MNYNQVYSIVNAAASQTFGKSAVATIDLTGLVSLGNTVFSSSNNKEKFLGTLMDMCGKTVIRNLDLSLEFPNLMADEFTFGAILRKISFKPFEAKSANYVNVGEQNFSPSLYNIDKPQVTQKLFTDADAWEFDVTIPDTLFKPAFQSAGEMATFISGIMDAMHDSVVMSLNNMARLAISNFVGEKVHNSNGVVNLLSAYNTMLTQEYTAADVMHSADFFKFASKTMKDYIDYLTNPSSLYNIGGMVRKSNKEDMHVLINSQFGNAFDTYLSADTFHNELVALPGHKSVTHWQGSGTSVSFENNTSIKIKTTSGDVVDQSYVIGVFADKHAIVTGYTDQFTATDRNNRDRYTNYTFGETHQYINDLSENGIIFTLA